MKLNLNRGSSLETNKVYEISIGGVKNIEAVAFNMLGAANGVGISTLQNKLEAGKIRSSERENFISLDGPSFGIETKKSTFKITNFCFNRTYSVSSPDGFISIDKDTISFTPNKYGTTTFKVNNRTLSFEVKQLVVGKPSIIEPVVKTNLLDVVNFVSSPFDNNGFDDTHKQSDWEMSTSADFTTIFKSSYQSLTNKTTWSASGLEKAKTYFVRVRHKGNVLPVSLWSEVYVVSTSSTGTIKKPSIVTPTNNTTATTTDVTLSLSVFKTIGWTDTHKETVVEVTNLSTPGSVPTEVAKTTDLLSYVYKAGLFNVLFSFRIKYTGVSFGSSSWSDPVYIRTALAPILTAPMISSMDHPPKAGDYLSISYFNECGGSPTDYEGTEYIFSRDALMTDVVFSSSLAKLSSYFPSDWGATGRLALRSGLPTNYLNSAIFLKVRHKGIVSGYTPWSLVTELVTGIVTNATPATVNYYSYGSSTSTYKRDGYETAYIMKYYVTTPGSHSYSYSWSYSDEGGSGSSSGGGSSPAGVSDSPYANYLIIFSGVIPGRGVTMTMSTGQIFNL